MICSVNRAEVERCCKLFMRPGEVHEVRLLGGGQPVKAGWFDDSAALVREVEDLEAATKPKGFYFTLNPCRGWAKNKIERNRKTTSDNDITRRRFFVCDFDPLRPTDTASTQAEHDAAEAVARGIAKWLTDEFKFPDPILADSGNGAHLLYHVDLPNDTPTRRLFDSCLAGIKQRAFSDPDKGGLKRGISFDTSISNASRIWRLYGTMNRKGRDTTERPWRLSRILEAPEKPQIVTRETLEALAASHVKVQQNIAQGDPNEALANEGRSERLPMKWGKLDDGKKMMRAWIDRWLGENSVLKEEVWPDSNGLTWWKFVLTECPFNPDHNRGEATITVSDGNKRRFRCLHNSCHDNLWPELRMKVGDIKSTRRYGDEDSRRNSEKVLDVIRAIPHELFKSPDGTPFITIFQDGNEGAASTRPVQGSWLTDWIRWTYEREQGSTVAAETIKEVVATLRSKAVMEGKTHKMFLRSAFHDGVIYIDLASASGDVIRIDRGGWCITRCDIPVKFYRMPNQAPLPVPTRGGERDLAAFRQFINVNDADWPLVIGWLCDAMKGREPYHILILNGEQGSGKSDAATFLTKLIDPLREAQIAGLAKNERELAIDAFNQFVVTYDNLSHLDPRMSDALCRLSVGGGLKTRKLYTDSEQVRFGQVRPVVLAGIADFATAPDLLDRSLIISLPELKEQDKREEVELNMKFKAFHPEMLGALCDMLVRGLQSEDVVDSFKPRMLDSYRWMFRCVTNRQEFRFAYQAKRNEAIELGWEASPVAEPIVSWLKTKTGYTFVGKSSELWSEFTFFCNNIGISTMGRAWPQSALGLTRRLKGDKPLLRKHGVTFREPLLRDTNYKRYELCIEEKD